MSWETISRITDKVLEEMQAWQTRPLGGSARSTRIFVCSWARHHGARPGRAQQSAVKCDQHRGLGSDRACDDQPVSAHALADPSGSQGDGVVRHKEVVRVVFRFDVPEPLVGSGRKDSFGVSGAVVEVEVAVIRLPRCESLA